MARQNYRDYDGEYGLLTHWGNQKRLLWKSTTKPRSEEQHGVQGGGGWARPRAEVMCQGQGEVAEGSGAGEGLSSEVD